MKTSSRGNTLAGALLAGLALTGSALAQDFPSRRITLMVGYSAGGPADLAARVIADKLRDRFNQPVIIENRPAGAAQASFDATKSAAPDGYVLGLGTLGMITLKLTSKAYTIDPLKDFTYVGQFSSASLPLMLFASANAPFKTAAEFVAYARANPGKMNFGTYATSGELELSTLMVAANVSITKVPYKGSAPMQIALGAGEIDAVIDNFPSAKTHVDAGRARLLAVGSRERLPDFPNVPSISEAVPGYEIAPFWLGLIGPANLPGDIVNRLNEAINTAMRQPDAASRLAPLGQKPAPGSPAEFRALVTRENDRLTKAASMIGLQPQ